MAHSNSTRNTTDEGESGSAGVGATGQMLLRGVERVLRGVGFWSAVVLPLLAVALLIGQPSGWLPALSSVFAINAIALYVGHCHDRRC